MTNQNLFKLFLQLSLTIPLLVLSYFVYLFWQFNYSDLLTYLLNLADKTEWTNYFKEQILPINRFYIARYILLSSMLLYAVFLIFNFKKTEKWSIEISEYSSIFLKDIHNGIIGLTKNQMLFLLTILLLFSLRSIYHIIIYELQYDEAWTYVHFSSKGFLVSAFSPNNNHTFYSILCATIDFLPLDKKWVIRLPSLLFTLFSLVAIFAFLRKIISTEMGFIALLFLSFSSSFTFFSFLGRSYGMLLFFCIINLIAFWGISKNNEKSKAYTFLFILSTILGNYSSQAFLYIWICFIILLIIYNQNRAVKIFKVNFIIALISFILYSPSLMAGSYSIFNKAIGSSSINTLEFQYYWIYLNRIASWLIWPNAPFLFIIILGLLAILTKLHTDQNTNLPDKKLLLVCITFILSPFAFTLISGIHAPERIWNYVVIFLFIGVALVIVRFNKSTFLKILTTVIIVSALFIGSEIHYFINWSAKLDKEAKKIADIVMSNNNQLNCLIYSRYDKPLLDYYFLINKKKITCYMPFKESKNYASLNEISYDIILFETEEYKANNEDRALLKKYNLVFKNQRIELYFKNQN